MQDGRRRLVGVVDDDAAVRDSLRFLLEAANFLVVTFHSAGQFLAAPGQRRPSLALLLDRHMPEIDRASLLRQLRRECALSAGRADRPSPSAQLARQALELGAAVVLEKPLAEQALFNFVGNTGA